MVLSLEAVRKSFRDSDGIVPVLQDVSFELKAGQTLALRGESGSGKSTLLHIAGALEAADAVDALAYAGLISHWFFNNLT